MLQYSYQVVVKGEDLTQEQADQVIGERLNHDEDYGFPYTIEAKEVKEDDLYQCTSYMVYVEDGKPVKYRCLKGEGHNYAGNRNHQNGDHLWQSGFDDKVWVASQL